MPTTPDGLPYAVGTDLVRDGDNVIAALAAAISGLSRWVKVGRVDREIEGNGFLRLLVSEAWPSNKVPAAVIPVGIDGRFRAHWDGSVDGSGCLLRVFDPVTSNQYGPGSSVAIYFVAVRPAGSA